MGAAKANYSGSEIKGHNCMPLPGWVHAPNTCPSQEAQIICVEVSRYVELSGKLQGHWHQLGAQWSFAFLRSTTLDQAQAPTDQRGLSSREGSLITCEAQTIVLGSKPFAQARTRRFSWDLTINDPKALQRPACASSTAFLAASALAARSMACFCVSSLNRCAGHRLELGVKGVEEDSFIHFGHWTKRCKGKVDPVARLHFSKSRAHLHRDLPHSLNRD